MTKAEYLQWIASRGDKPGLWNPEKCRAADLLIKRETIKALNRYLDQQNLDRALETFIKIMVYANFGSIEVDDLLTHLKCYPEWTL